MTRCHALAIGFVLALAMGSDAAGQSATPARGTPRSRPAIFNPFESLSLSRFSFNRFGFVRVRPAAPLRQSAASATAATPSAAAPTTATTASADDDGDVIPVSTSVRLPYRPPPRSPFRPGTRPPFGE